MGEDHKSMGTERLGHTSAVPVVSAVVRAAGVVNTVNVRISVSGRADPSGVSSSIEIRDARMRYAFLRILSPFHPFSAEIFGGDT